MAQTDAAYQYVYGYFYLNGVRQAMIKYAGGGGIEGLASFNTTPVVFAFVSTVDNPTISIVVSASASYRVVKNIPLVFTVVGLKK